MIGHNQGVLVGRGISNIREDVGNDKMFVGRVCVRLVFKFVFGTIEEDVECLLGV